MKRKYGFRVALPGPGNWMNFEVIYSENFFQQLPYWIAIQDLLNATADPIKIRGCLRWVLNGSDFLSRPGSCDHARSVL